ncbi:8-demethyl-8-(2,3-dimethoxy-alpha-L-rhamnosyl)-tetracenomycin-C 4'-O-methyltransferase-like [Amphiura filiformis]|uniref:8-demethyl-8-(2, 3-dimethoxy-alpha-L-rhamnosyl)-tetracenomycin-C 4'-O-methyltransferase-like n=1 Tax=Amphiura filiformis TaxID=82378 RepID=UPI003B21A5CF
MGDATVPSTKPAWEDKMWDSYNFLMKCPDVSRLRKLLARHELFKMSLEIPGDIVECGVFKGTGLMQFLKLRQIYIPNSIKKVIGFDLFHTQPELSGNDDTQMNQLFKDAQFTGIDPEELRKAAEAITGNSDSVELIAGDVTKTCQEYATSRPGFRISFLHMDLDVEIPTLKSLEALWPKVCKGGVIVFDEYAISRWSESNAIDKFLEDKPNQKLRTLPWAHTPTAYIIKE